MSANLLIHLFKSFKHLIPTYNFFGCNLAILTIFSNRELELFCERERHVIAFTAFLSYQF